MIQVDSNSPVSIYEQVYEEFVKLISKGVLRSDEQLPSVRDLAAMLRINPNTIQKAYKLLETREFIYSLPGKGSFVAAPQDLISAELQRERELFVQSVKKLQKLGMSDQQIIQDVEQIIKGGRDHA